MSPFLSHPDLTLREHVNQVVSAMEVIMAWHSEIVFNERIRSTALRAARLHDLGKATPAFQAYIKQPTVYQGDPSEKSHSPLSTLMALLILRAENCDLLEILTIASVICGHHGKLPTFPSQNPFETQPSSRSLDSILLGKTGKILQKQLASTDFASLEAELDYRLSALNFDQSSLRQARLYLERSVFPASYSLSPQQALRFRFEVQLVFSLLLESDKAFLAVKNPHDYTHRITQTWQPEWIQQYLANRSDSAVNVLRDRARSAVLGKIQTSTDNRIYSLTAPTGLGKTLLAATWALTTANNRKETHSIKPKIIVALPFLSIIDQTTKVYEKLLPQGKEQRDGSWLLTAHSLAHRHYGGNLEEETERFFIDTWRTEIVIMTYDQLLLAMFDPSARHQMRFHNLCDAVIIMDEVQSIPCRLWQLLEAGLQGLSEIGNSDILLMSATLPPFLHKAVPLLDDYQSYFRHMNRYKLHFNLDPTKTLDEFIASIMPHLPVWIEEKERVLFTLNTRNSAKTLWKKIRDEVTKSFSGRIFLISADITPKDRLEKIERIRGSEPCIVVSTQCIEAGVDLDMTRIFRDFAPWDSIVQVAGRCNREGIMNQPRPVEIIELKHKNGKRYAAMIYDPVHLSATRKTIERVEKILESEVLDYSEEYFSHLAKSKDTGERHLQRFLQWQEDEPVRELLRGKQREQYSFIVSEQDPELLQDLTTMMQIEDKWKRREALRNLSARIALVSINLYARHGFDPHDLAFEHHGFWVLRAGLYSSAAGLELDEETEQYDQGWINC